MADAPLSRPASVGTRSLPRDVPPMMISAVGHALENDLDVSDAAIDFWMTDHSRSWSPRYWTPVAVARTAARWIAELGGQTVLDAGAGAGKFCVVAALATDLRVTGVEQRRHLALEATSLARRFRVDDRCEVLAGTIDRVDLTAFDALYVFNSFAENVYPEDEQLDDTVELSPRRMRRDLLTVEAALARMPVGAMFVTYHGFGGQIPDTFEVAREDDACGTGPLKLWRKRRSEPRGKCWVEVADEMMEIAVTPATR
jgi:hypothetical protein